MTDLEVRPTHLLDELSRNGALLERGLKLSDPNITYEQMEAVGALLGEMRKRVQFAIGDWLVAMEERFPEQFSQAVEVLDMGPEGLRDYIRVARQVPRSTRRPRLSFSHHRAVASLPPKEQKEWLAKAEVNNWNHGQFRDALRPKELQPQREVCGECGRPI